MRGRCRRQASNSHFARCTAVVSVGHIGNVEVPGIKQPEPRNDLPAIEIIMNTLTRRVDLPGLVTAAILGLLIFGCTAPCIADDSGDIPHAVVRFGDLDLASAQGAATLYRRIVWAAYEVCNSFDIDIHDLEFPAEQVRCVHKAVAHAVIKVGRPELFAIYKARNRDPLPITVANDRNP
jgi:UrcA family protein